MFYMRRAQVVVGDDTEEIQIPANPITGEIKIEFQIRSALTGDKPKDNFISIYNLSDATQSFITKKAQRIRLYAGYGNDRPPIIFDGQITVIDNGRYAVDSILKMTLADQVFNLNAAHFSKSYSGTVTVRSIIEDALPSFGVIATGLETIPMAQLTNFSFDGQTKVLFTQLLKPLGVLWYTEVGVIRFSQNGVARPDLTTVLLNQNTGMIESPKRTEKGIRVLSLLNNQLRLGGLVQIQSQTLQQAGGGRTSNQLSYSTDGVYKINELTHKGNNHDGQMVTEILAVSLRSQ